MQRGLVAADRVELAVANAGGGAEECLVGDAGDVGELLGDEGAVACRCDRRSATRPSERAPPKRFTSEPACPSKSKSMRTSGGSEPPQAQARRTSSRSVSALRKSASSMASAIDDLPASLGPRMTVRPAAGLISRDACVLKSDSRRRVMRMARATSRGWGRRAASDAPSRRIWRASSAASWSPLASAARMRASTSATNRPATVSLGSAGPALSSVTERSRTRTCRNAGASVPFDLIGVDLQGVGSDAVDGRPQHEVRVGELSQTSHQLLLVGQAGGVDRLGEEARAPHPDAFDLHAARMRRTARISLQHRRRRPQGAPGRRFRPILVHRHRLRRTRISPRRVAGSTARVGVPVAQRQVVEAAGGDLSIGE